MFTKESEKDTLAAVNEYCDEKSTPKRLTSFLGTEAALQTHYRFL